jgi:Complex I intermediate-associated protein 30 (CIA30)
MHAYPFPFCTKNSLKTSDCTRPQISYRATFDVPVPNPLSPWTNIRIPFEQFRGYNIDIPVDVSKLTRIGIVAIGREMEDIQLHHILRSN